MKGWNPVSQFLFSHLQSYTKFNLPTRSAQKLINYTLLKRNLLIGFWTYTFNGGHEDLEVEHDFLDSEMDFLGTDKLLTGLFALATLEEDVCKIWSVKDDQ